MLSETDRQLWNHVARSVCPMGHPRPTRRAHPITIHRAVPPVLDLHGQTVDAAFRRTLDFIHENRRLRRRHISVITGRSGQIRAEFHRWLDHPEITPLIGGATVASLGGAFQLTLR